MKKGERYPPEVLTHDEVLALMKACGPSRTGKRNRALIAVLYRCGLRVSEALDLTPKDVDVYAGAVRVLHGKGDKARTVGIDERALNELAAWLDERDHIPGITPNHPLFCTLSGEHVTSAYVRQMLPRIAKRARIWKRVHAHGLRHTHAYELMMEGVPVGIIQRQLGHSSASTTSRYLDHIAPAEVLSAIQKRAW